MLLFLLLLSPGAGSAGECEVEDELRVLGCLGGTADWATSSLHPSFLDVHTHCRRFSDYQICASVVPDRCRTSVAAALEDVYEVLCNDTMQLELKQESGCWLEMSQNTHFRNCQIESVVNGTMEFCGSLQSYVDCALDTFWDKCPRGVRLLAQFFHRAYPSCAHNITFVEPFKDPSQPNCTESRESTGRLCSCTDGYTYDPITNTCLDVDECSELSVCSQRCANSAGAFTCLCDPEHYDLDADGRTCTRKDNSSLWIFFAHGQSIWNISSSGKDFQLQRAALQKTAMIDLDIQERRLYYADIGANKMERMMLEGAFPNTLQSFDVEGTEGIAVDWIGRNLYSLRQKTMIVQALDGRFRKVLYTQITTLPRALALHPLIGYAYVTDWSGEAFIGRAAMDGSGMERLITEGVVWPNGLAVDFYADKLYWADAFLDTIQMADLDGGNRRTVVSKSGSVPHVFGLALIDDFLYWTDWTYRGILRADKHTGDNVTVLAQTALLPYGIKIFHPVMQPKGAENPCESLNCSQLCLIRPSGGNETRLVGECACAEGWELERGEAEGVEAAGGVGVVGDGERCVANCDGSQILCGGSDPKCISRLHWCDGSVQCRDGADEAECPERRCLPGQFQCHDSSKCLHVSSLCDGNAQCDDSSDEKYCN